jgi:hypothetical protein
MWKSAESIPKVGGKGEENSFIVFPTLRHFQALPATLCDDWRQTRSGWLAKQNRIERPFA